MSWLRRSIFATAFALAAVVAIVLAHAYPSTEAVRLRNALLMVDGDPPDADWRPDRPPVGFLQESHLPPPLIAERAKQIGGAVAGGDFDIAKALASHLIERAHDLGPIESLDVEETYRAIVDDGRGYCADFIDAFIALSLAAGIPVRAWAFSFDGFGGHGHIVVEIFDRQRDKWLMLDVFNNVYPVREQTGEPLSAMELRNALLGNGGTAKFVRIGPGRLGFRIEAKLLDYYGKGLSEWYLWFGNNVISRGDHPLTNALGHLFEPLGELHAVARGVYPRIVPVRTEANSMQLRRMKLLKHELLWAAAIAVVLAFALLAQLAWWFARTTAPKNRPVAGITPPSVPLP